MRGNYERVQGSLWLGASKGVPLEKYDGINDQEKSTVAVPLD